MHLNSPYLRRMCGNSSYQSEPCTVSCPVDCQMSAWSEWGLCDSNCAYGLKNRTSKVVKLASVGGRPCPGPTVQYALCNYHCCIFHFFRPGQGSPDFLMQTGNQETKKMILYLSSVKKQEFCSLFTQVKEEKDKNYFSAIF